MKLSRTDIKKQAEFRHWLRQFVSATEKHSRELGLGASQYLLLLAIRGLPENLRPNVSTVAERLMVESHSVVELVDRCVQNGLLERFRDGADQRMVFLRLTEMGNDVVEKIALQNREELMQAVPTLLDFLKSLVG
jgi:DNA-binding MarR family transcriptional regulator